MPGEGRRAGRGGEHNDRRAAGLISASIAAADQAALGQAVAELSRHVDVIHIDVEDGVFSPNITLGPAAVRDLRRHSRLPFEVHMMVARPEDQVRAIAEAGADVIIVNVEACPYPLRTVRLIRSFGKRAGLAFNWGTPLGALPYLADELDCVLLMTSEPDLDAQAYIGRAPGRVAEARRVLAAGPGGRESPRPVGLVVDGGVDDGNIAELQRQGAGEFVVGRHLWRTGDVGASVRALRAALGDYRQHGEG